jgi:hypothetical protein
MAATLEERTTLWTPEGTARRVGLRPSTLANRRSRGLPPTFVRCGGRIMYRACDIAEWVDAPARTSTSDPGPLCRHVDTPLRPTEEPN